MNRNSKCTLFSLLYYAMIALWLLQIVIQGMDVYLIIPTVCLLASYFMMKKYQ